MKNDKNDRKYLKLQGEGSYIYEGFVKTSESSKVVYDGAGYLFNNETKCFFKGTWSHNEKVCGMETFPNGDVYEGSYLNGKFHGQGLLYNNTRGKYKYEGFFINGRKEGLGREDYLLGGFYEGHFKQGLKHGQGKLTFTDGSYYMGDFQKGLPNGFGLQVANSRDRIVTIFPLIQVNKKKKVNDQDDDQDPKGEIEEDESQSQSESQISDEEQINTQEYYYEGEFVDGYKHGIGRLFEPSGSYFYGYWEYNKPVQKTIYYNADNHSWKTLEIPSMADSTDINFYRIIDNLEIKLNEGFKISGYPDYKLDGYKSLIDEKGLKREHLEDPDFDFSESSILVKDESGTPQLAPVEYKRIKNLQCFSKNEFKLFSQEINPGCLYLQETYSCQQLTCVLDSLTYHSALFQKIFTRKYDVDIGFYILRFYIKNQWKDFIIDDLIPVNKNDSRPIFSNSETLELGWVLIFKAFAKMKQNFMYFENINSQIASEYLNTLTGMPCKEISLLDYFQDQLQDKEEKLQSLWNTLINKHQRTQIRICYLQKLLSLKMSISNIYAYQLIDMIQTTQFKQTDEDKFVLMKSLDPSKYIKTPTNDPYQQNLGEKQIQAINKLKERNKINLEDQRYFILGFKEFIEYFDKIFILMASKYTIHNQQELIPREEEKYNNDIRIYTRFNVNLPTSLLFSVTQAHLPVTDQVNGQLDKDFKSYLPVRLVLAKEKDKYSNKNQVKKSFTKQLQNIRVSNIQTPKSNDFKKSQISYSNKSPLKTQDQEIKITKQHPFKYVFGRGQKQQKQIYKEVTLETGVYILLIQIEASDGKTNYYPFEKLRFYLSIYCQNLIQIQRIPQIDGFQNIVYETAILNAEKYQHTEGKEPKFFSKVDLSERENGSSDLIIMQYFLKNEGTYLQYLRNKSTNKIWRQKLYFRVENMLILDQNDQQKVDLQINNSDKRTHLVIIQQIKAKQYNLEGGEGICIIDIQNEKREDYLQQEENLENSQEDEEHQQKKEQQESKPKFDLKQFSLV